MHAWKHFKTITFHKFLVMKGCFAVGLYRQGLLHDLIMLNGKRLAIHPHGFIIKAETGTIMNIGLTTAPMKEQINMA